MTLSKSCATTLVALVLVTAASSTAIAQSKQTGTLSITLPWIRATPPKAATAGGFVTIENPGTGPDRLVAAASPIAGRAEIHEMRMENGTMIMRAAEGGVEIPAGGKVTLAPGGLHIMFMDLNQGLVEGDTVPVTLSFEGAGDIEVLFPIEAIGARGPTGNGEHTAEPSADMGGSNGSHMHGHGQ